MNLHSLRFRYTAVFIFIAIIMAVAAFESVIFIKDSTKISHALIEKFTPAISAVLNADRDLYQARVAERDAFINPTQISNLKKDYEENAQQAFDRMNTYLDLMQGYPKVETALKGFDSAYQQWEQQSAQVFKLIEQNKTSEALTLSNGNSQQTFSALRDLYNIAGELAEQVAQKENQDNVAAIESRTKILIMVMTVIIIFSLATGYFAPRQMSIALRNLEDKLKGINSGSGDLSQRINSTRKDEVGFVSNEFDQFLGDLSELIKNIVAQSNTVLSNTTSLNEGSNRVQQSSNSQLESIEMIVTAVNELSVAIKDVAKNAQLTANEIDDVRQLTEQGKEITIEAVKQSGHVSETVGNASTAISELATSSNNIASVLDVIRGIAEQTNLLALNAAIEAARAGEQGRGFAVVADEVRSLASKTQASTDDIQAMIETLQKSVKEAVHAIEGGLVSVNASVEKSQSTMTALDNIVLAAQRVSDAATQIATSTEQQHQVTEEVNQNLIQLSEHAKDSLKDSEENNNLSTHATDVAQQLNKSVIRFKLS